MCKSHQWYEEELIESNAMIKANVGDAAAYLKRADAYVGLGNFSEAEAAFAKAIEIQPSNAEAYYARGNLYAIHLHNLEKAIADYSQAIKLDPDKCAAYHNRSNCYKQLHQDRLAEQDMLKSQEILARLRALGIEPMPPPLE